MSPGTIILIAVPVLVVLAGVLLFASARRRDTDSAHGVLSSETARRDRGPVELSESDHRATGREVERAAVLARREAEAPVKVAEPPVAWVPPDDETVGVTRRQFFNRSIVVSFALGLSTFGAGVRRLANAWSVGDIGALRQLVPTYSFSRDGFRSGECAAAMHGGERQAADYKRRRTRLWLNQAKRALKNNQRTMAVVPMSELFASDGYLVALRAAGYEIEEP